MPADLDEMELMEAWYRDYDQKTQAKWQAELDRVVRERDEVRREVGSLRRERQAILDAINLYGDETLHRALDDAGLLTRAKP